MQTQEGTRGGEEEVHLLSLGKQSLLRVFFSPTKSTCCHSRLDLFSYSTKCLCNGGEEFYRKDCRVCLRRDYFRSRGFIVLGEGTGGGGGDRNAETFEAACQKCKGALSRREKSPSPLALRLERLARVCSSIYFYFFFSTMGVLLLSFVSCLFGGLYAEHSYCGYLTKRTKSLDGFLPIFGLLFQLLLNRDTLLIDRVKSACVVDSNTNCFDKWKQKCEELKEEKQASTQE